MRYLLIFCLTMFIISTSSAQEKRALTFEDIMKFRLIKDPSISSSGNWTSFTSKPDTGNSDAVFISTDKQKEFEIYRGTKPKISLNENWGVATILPDAETHNKEKDAKDDLVLINLNSGDTTFFNDVKKYDFSNDSKWIGIHFHKEEKKDSTAKKDEKKKKEGSPFYLLNLESKENYEIPFVITFSFDSLSNFAAYSTADTSGNENGLFLFDLNENEKIIIDTIFKGEYSFSWDRKNKLAYLKSVLNDKEEPGPADLFIRDGETELSVKSSHLPEGLIIPAKNNLQWTKDGERLFFGYKVDSKKKNDEKKNDSTSIYDREKILDKKSLTIWHTDDPLIQTHQKVRWKEVKDQTYSAVFHFSSNMVEMLADSLMPYLVIPQNENYALGYSDIGYRKEITWSGWYYDFYAVDLNTGERKKITDKVENYVQLSPGGNFAVYYKNKNWFLYDVKKDLTRNLTEKLKVVFYDEDHDLPGDPNPYGIAGWTENDNAILIYDKFDLWKFDTQTGKAVSVTNSFGRKNDLQLRIKKTEPEEEFINENKELLATAYHDKEKFTAFYSINISQQQVKKLLQEKMKYKYLSKAKSADKYLFTKESYTVFPDLWVTDADFSNPKKITDHNKQTEDFLWGEAELVEWKRDDGVPLQGVLIKPGNYKEGEKFPVLVYYYEISSDRLYEFNEMVVNHRPNFPFYASNGYGLFLPDIKFEIGKPGPSATKSLVSGVNKIIEMGYANPDAIALHGHSWSGYQTAFVVTETDIFKCAIAGAPVSNMTSAYSGIRYGSGVARQFQYEMQQSRIGGSMWELQQKYIENSPVFFADRINTPLLIQHGDEDEAVPWNQSVELYLAMRRLGKDCIFLQYKGEPHHLKKYANKLDYSIKMKQYIDYHLKGEDPADWIKEATPYSE